MLRERTDTWRNLAERLARPAVILSFLFLVIVAAALQRVTSLLDRDPTAGVSLEELRLFLIALAILWPVFLLESLAQGMALTKERRDARRLASALLVALFPPLRLGARSPVVEDRIWLPRLGWQEVDADLRHRLERAFSIPMILIALMILPVLVIEYGWSDRLLRDLQLGLFLDLATGLIWLAFATEFILMCSIAENKLAYVKQHWIDLAIILLPLISLLRFARVLRLGRLARLKQVTSASRVYRLRGVATRAYRAAVVLDLLHRLSRRSTEKRLERLRAEVAAKEAEIQGLHRQIASLEALIAQRSGPERR
jgi:voltage-gated potassium channel